jgi:nitrite reductase (NADH) small subunit/3-phenylpropionate/trans-cinnamate dioxygenase ferredoxin subunit
MRFDELPDDGTGIVRVVGGRRVALFRSGAELFAIDDACPHLGASLGGGVLRGREVTCPWHSFHFDVCSGRNTDGLGEELDVFEVRVRPDGHVEVRVAAGSDLARDA